MTVIYNSRSALQTCWLRNAATLLLYSSLLLKLMIKHYSNHDASYQKELYVLSCGDVHPNPGHTHRNGASNASNDNPPLQSREKRATSIVNKIAKLQMELASNSFDVIVLTKTHLDSSITDTEMFGREYCVYRKDRQ